MVLAEDRETIRAGVDVSPQNLLEKVVTGDNKQR